MKTGFLAFLSVFLLSSFLSAPTRAQSINGSISGVVTDQNDAAIPGATITVTNTSTGQSRRDVTDDEGLYRINGLPVGNTYTVKAEKAGYSIGTNDNVQVSSGVNTDANFKLGAAMVTASVDVSNTGASLKTTQSQGSKTAGRPRILELPGRDSLKGLALLDPRRASRPEKPSRFRLCRQRRPHALEQFHD
jgi:hypothetical protein